MTTINYTDCAQCNRPLIPSEEAICGTCHAANKITANEISESPSPLIGFLVVGVFAFIFGIATRLIF